MAKNKKSKTIKPPSRGDISSIIGPHVALPSESEEAYEAGLLLLIDELRASSPLQVFLVEQIYESMVWVKRCQRDKRGVIRRRMASLLSEYPETTEEFEEGLIAVSENPDDEEWAEWLSDMLSRKNYSLETLELAATNSSLDTIKRMDDSIRLHMNNIRQVQRSLDVAEMKPLLKKRLELQVSHLERDLHVIEQE